ncbi:hypothetical protein JCM6882_004365 [Rhodosporidiobolus microsporus]
MSYHDTTQTSPKYNNHPWPETGLDYFGPDSRRAVLAELFQLSLDDVKTLPLEIEPPFACDYGTNIRFRGPLYANFNLTILDCNRVTFGARCLLGPNVQIYASTLSSSVEERQAGLERAYAVEIGDDCFIGGNAVVCGPARIGKGVTIAAGAFVQGDIPDYVVVAGSPARIVKHLKPSTEVTDASATAPPPHRPYQS